MIRVVVDPSVLVSAAIGREGSAPDLVFAALSQRRIEAIVSPLLLYELEDVLQRPKFARADLDEREVLIGEVRSKGTHVEDPPDRPAATRDAKDDYLVALALAQGVDAIISLDRDLLDADLGELPVWTPRELVDRLGDE